MRVSMCHNIDFSPPVIQEKLQQIVTICKNSHLYKFELFVKFFKEKKMR